jgi:hypothetical protein
MKSNRILVAAALLTAVATYPLDAQVAIKGGLSYGKVDRTGTVPGELGNRTGFALGLSFSTPPSLMGLGVDVLYAQRGANPGALESRWELDYIDLPIYLRVMAPSEGVAPYAYAGPQVSFEVRCRQGLGECFDGRTRTTYAGVIGAGLRLGGDSGALFLEGRYHYGLRDLDLVTVTEDSNYRDRSFMILAGIGM